MSKNRYISPEIEAVNITKTDILTGSDVIIDGSGLFDDTQD